MIFFKYSKFGQNEIWTAKVKLCQKHNAMQKMHAEMVCGNSALSKFLSFFFSRGLLATNLSFVKQGPKTFFFVFKPEREEGQIH